MGETDVNRSNGTSGPGGFWDTSRRVGTSQRSPWCPWFVNKDGRGLVVRPYDDADWDILAKMYRDYDPSARSMGLPPTDEAHITEWLPNLVNRGRSFIAVADRGIVGRAAYVAGDDPEPELAVSVHQDSHDRDIETGLRCHVTVDTANAEREALIPHVAPDSQRAVYVYRELGFETVSSDGMDTKIRLDLTPSAPPVARPTIGTEGRG